MHAIAQVVWSARGPILTPGMGWRYVRRSSARRLPPRGRCEVRDKMIDRAQRDRCECWTDPLLEILIAKEVEIALD